MTIHSIIIPHRDRARTLWLCLWSIHRSAVACHRSDYEIIVVDAGEEVVSRPVGVDFRVVRDEQHGQVFNKPRLLNLGIEAAGGDVLSFLDADAVVGRKWIAGAHWLLVARDLTKLCYRVKQLPIGWLDVLESDDERSRSDRLSELFSRWDEFKNGFEAYGSAETGWWTKHSRPDGPIFGNSQFSIRRDVLGDLRFNEQYVGGGYEDIWMNREIFRRSPCYRAELFTHADSAMYHLHRKRICRDDDGWCSRSLIVANRRRYETS